MNSLRQKVFLSLFLFACCTATRAQSQADCADADKAASYVAAFDKRLGDAKAHIEARNAVRERQYRHMRSRIVAAGTWSEKDASTFMFEVTIGSQEGKRLETARVNAIKEFWPLMFELGTPIAAGGDIQTERRRHCMLGQQAMTQLEAVESASNAAWDHVMLRMAAFGRENGVAGF